MSHPSPAQHRMLCPPAAAAVLLGPSTGSHSSLLPPLSWPGCRPIAAQWWGCAEGALLGRCLLCNSFKPPEQQLWHGIAPTLPHRPTAWSCPQLSFVPSVYGTHLVACRGRQRRLWRPTLCLRLPRGQRPRCTPSSSAGSVCWLRGWVGGGGALAEHRGCAYGCMKEGCKWWPRMVC